MSEEDDLDAAKAALRHHGPFTATHWRCRESRQRVVAVGSSVVLPDIRPCVSYVTLDEMKSEAPSIPLTMDLGRFLDNFDKITDPAEE